MDRKLLTSHLKALRLKTSNTGVLSDDDGYEYGILTQEEFRTVDGRIIHIDNVSQVSSVPINRELTFAMFGGEYVTVAGGHMSSEDRQDYELKQMPTSISALNDVFPLLYPNSHMQLYYDELMERNIIDMSMLDRPEEGLVPMTDTIQSLYYENIERKLLTRGFFGRLPALKTRDHVLSIRTHNNSRNLFREWVEAHEWDGVPRLRRWFQDTFGATAPPLESEMLDEKYLGDVSEAWFIGGIKRMYSETKHEIVPVLISPQGIGKGLALKYTAGSDRWYMETSANVQDPQRFLESMRGHVVVELSESSAIRSSDSELLKAFISVSSDHMRKPFGRFDESYPRHFILVATSNLDNIFTDITGNRRFFPMYCDPTRATRRFSEDRRIGQYDVEQVWAEALHCFRNGGKWYMSQESADLARIMQDFGAQENSNISVIDDWLDKPINGHTELGDRVTKQMIMAEVFGLDPEYMIPKDAENAFRAWANGQRSWQKVANPVRMNGKVCRAYERTVRPGEVKETTRLNIVNGDDGMPPDLVDIMRKRATEFEFRKLGDLFPTDGLPRKTVEMLVNEGYIAERRGPEGSEYMLIYLP